MSKALQFQSPLLSGEPGSKVHKFNKMLLALYATVTRSHEPSRMIQVTFFLRKERDMEFKH